MKLLHQNPPPPLLTGHSPPAQPVRNQSSQAGQPRFGALIGIGGNAVSQFTTDTLGVWAPKVPITRSKSQFFEDAFLELVEDGAFYFTLPVVGPLIATGLAKAYANHGDRDWRKNADLTKLAKHLDLEKNGEIDTRKLAGQPMRKISEKLKTLVEENKFTQDQADKMILKLVRTKAGALIGTVGVAAGFEYMIQHTKNVITAKAFNTKNFAAVAGLEKGKAHTAEGLDDPVEKAKKRGKQAGAFVLGTLGAAALTPWLLKFGGLKKAENVMKLVDCAPGFDISKPVLAMLISVGVASYLDAARDPLEKKETGTRLCVVVPYLLFGKELAGFGIAKFLENFKKVTIGQDGNGKDIKKPIKDIIPFANANPFQQMITREKLLDFGVVDKDKDFLKKLASKEVTQKLQNLVKDDVVREQVKGQIIHQHSVLGISSYLFGALCCGLGMNWIIYKQTQARYKQQQAEAKQQQQNPNAQPQAAQDLPPIVNDRPQAAAQPKPVSPWPQRQPVAFAQKSGFPQPFTPFVPVPNHFVGQAATPA